MKRRIKVPGQKPVIPEPPVMEKPPLRKGGTIPINDIPKVTVEQYAQDMRNAGHMINSARLLSGGNYRMNPELEATLRRVVEQARQRENQQLLGGRSLIRQTSDGGFEHVVVPDPAVIPQATPLLTPEERNAMNERIDRTLALQQATALTEEHAELVAAERRVYTSGGIVGEPIPDYKLSPNARTLLGALVLSVLVTLLLVFF